MERFIVNYAIIFGIIYLTIGYLFCFFGYKLFKIVAAILGLSIGGIIGALLGGMGGDQSSALLGFFLGGIIGAFLLFFLYRVAVFLMGAFMGLLFLGLLTAIGGGGFHPAIAILFFLIGGFLALFLEKLIIIIGSAFSGASAIVYGVFFLNLSKRNLYNLISNRTNPSDAIIILMLTIVLTIIGIMYQYGTLQKIIKSIKGKAIENKFTNNEIDEKVKKKEVLGFNNNFDSSKIKGRVLESIQLVKDKFATIKPSRSKRENLPNIITFPIKLKNEASGQVLNVYGIYINGKYKATLGRAFINGAEAVAHLQVDPSDKTVSGRQAEFYFYNNIVELVNISGTNNTKINNRILAEGESVQLNSGDRIIVGLLNFIVLK